MKQIALMASTVFVFLDLNDTLILRNEYSIILLGTQYYYPRTMINFKLFLRNYHLHKLINGYERQ